MHGGATSSELGVYVYAAAQVKKAMEVGTLLIEPKPHEPTKHQYDWDAATSANFLRKYGLEGKLKFTTFIGGLAPGGFNFDAKLRRESTDVEDLFIAHITGMDTLARGLRNVAKLIEVITSHKDQKQYWACENEPYNIVIVNEFAEAFQSFHEGRRLQDELAIPFDKSKIHPAAQTTHKYGASKKELLKACFSREFLLMKRNSFVYIFKLSQLTIMAVIASTLFLRTKMHHDSVNDGGIYAGALFFSVVINLFNGMAELSMTIARLPVFYNTFGSAALLMLFALSGGYKEVVDMGLLDFTLDVCTERNSG
uniref:ABC-2 type transporter transmembrane domain-containing protein n=1 Tax=Fagus sylvatica TaxID=28930 RepID=A0A2N9I0X4_FAGSY